MNNNIASESQSTKLKLEIFLYQFYVIFSVVLFGSFAIELNYSWFHIQLISLQIGHYPLFGSFIVAPFSFLSFAIGDHLSELNLYLISYFVFIAWVYISISIITPAIVAKSIGNSFFSWFYLLGKSEDSYIQDSIITGIISIIPYFVINIYLVGFLFSYFDPVSVDSYFSVHSFKFLFPVVDY